MYIYVYRVFRKMSPTRYSNSLIVAKNVCSGTIGLCVIHCASRYLSTFLHKFKKVFLFLQKVSNRFFIALTTPRLEIPHSFQMKGLFTLRVKSIA